MDYDGITVRKDTGVDHVAEIVLDRPDALNALNTAMAESIAEACADLGGDPASGRSCSAPRGQRPSAQARTSRNATP
ncbi:MAG: hypothetical protein WB688_04025 [Trebonia sp.]